MSQRLIALVTSALLIGGLFIGAPVRVQAVTDTVYVADVASAGAGGSCSAPDYATGVLDDDVAIQAAIDEVDVDGTLTTVYLCAGTYNITATLEPDQDIILEGASASTTILNGGATWDAEGYVTGGVRILYSVDDVTINNLTFTRGTAPSEGSNGGGAIAVNATVTVTSSIFTQNEGDYTGGAIYSYYNPLFVTDSTFTDNTASYGGAINTWDTAIVTDSTFIDNHATGGGAVRGDIVIVTNSTFAGNTATSDGGAIRAPDTATVTDSTFTGNSAATYGGAVNVEGEVTVTSSTFTSNSAENGGAIFAEGSTVTSSTFTSNSADYGGATFTFNNATVTSSTFTSNSAINGGAINASVVTVTNSSFARNSAVNAGGVIEASTGAISRSRFTRNTAGEHGGAVLLYAATDDLDQIRRNTFSRNTAPAGGAITLGPCLAATRREATRVERANSFSGNRATEERRTNNIERWLGGLC